MIRMIQSTSAKQAKKYFNEALTKSDYYLNSEELPGHIRGKLAERLGIDGVASKDVFQSLAENIHPTDGKKLTPRNSGRRTVGYDINFHCPKSVSIVHVLSKDNHILDAFQDSVTEIMCDIENDSKTRKRKSRQDEDVATGELVWADFIHQTARPVQGEAPDPHLHCHCFTFNATWDESEQRFKAAQFRNIKRDMPYYQAKFHKILSDRLISLGYSIRRTKTAFEIDGVPQNAIDHLSKRTDEIGQSAKACGITDAKELDALGSRTRAKKKKGLTMSGLKQDWRRQIRSLGLSQKQSQSLIRGNERKNHSKGNEEECIKHALDHCFERTSVVQDRKLLAKAFSYAIGNVSTSPSTIVKQFDNHPGLYKAQQGSDGFCTTIDIIQEEREMIDLALQGLSEFKPFFDVLPDTSLTDEQRNAVRYLMGASDQVLVIEGRAGTGKTTMMKEAVRLIQQSGKSVFVAAPSSEASRGVLRGEGFDQAETVAKLLHDEKLHDQLQGQVLWVDEAGLLGVKDMAAVLRLTVRVGARLILAGDTRQHSSVARGDALRILKDVAKLPSTSLTEIHRQKHAGYKKAIQAISKGNVSDGFNTLDQLGYIKSAQGGDHAQVIASGYVDAMKLGKSALIVSPTHQQGLAVTTAVRNSLKQKNKIGKKDHHVKQYIPCNMTDAEKADASNYKTGHILQINQNKPGMTRGSLWKVIDAQEKSLLLQDEHGKAIFFAVDKEKYFDVYQETCMPLAKGDLIKITRNGFDRNKKRINNGQALQLVSINKKGEIIARNPVSKAEYQLPANFGHIAHGYCLTSHASQGKTVDEVFIYQPSATFPATDMKQFYVSVSRGREKAHIYTDDKEALIGHASRMRDRQSGVELMNLIESVKDLTERPEVKPSARQRRPLYAL